MMARTRAKPIRSGKGGSRVGIEALAIRGGRPVRTRPFPQRRPFGEAEVRAATAAIRSQNLFWSDGTYVKAFEKRFPA
ncbi:MAG: hypothetical protein JXQ73_10850, partial [Phycisphaerae bacterium]|nr:hypothetical protein [Phycisphaerae bacterium]